MLNVIALGPHFFQSITGLSAIRHRAIVRDLSNSKLVYIIHRANPEEDVSLAALVDHLLGSNDKPFMADAEMDAFDEQSYLIWRKFLGAVFKYDSNRLISKNFYEFFDRNKIHAKNIWMHPCDAADFNLDSSSYSHLCFEDGIASDDFHRMLHSRRFSKAFNDENKPDDLLAVIDDELLDLPSQFYKTILLFDKYMAYTFFKHRNEGKEAPKDPYLKGFLRFLHHLKRNSKRSVTGVVLIGEYPFKDWQLLKTNNTELAFETLQRRTARNELFCGLQVEVMFVCPWDFPWVYHDRYCAWSSHELSHASDNSRTRFLDYFRLSFGNSERMDFRAADFWLQGGRGFQVYEEIRRYSSSQHVTFDWASDVEALENDLFYRFLSWPNVKDTTRRSEWASIDGHSTDHGFSNIYCTTL